jgi:predicted ArsR family transcriptional regulator
MKEIQATRRKILEILKVQGRATVNELAEQVGIAPVSVRHHLRELLREGLISTDGVENRDRVGRPQVLYTATPAVDKFFSADYETIVNYLLDELHEKVPAETIQDIFESVARRILAESDLKEKGSIVDRLQSITEFLSRHGYMARWEKADDDSGYYLLIHNCPYSQIPHDGSFCYMDKWLITMFLGREIEPIKGKRGKSLSCGYFIPA